jgi:hypothetical protein
MGKNSIATISHDEILIKLVKKEAMIKCVKGTGQEALLFTKGNAKAYSDGKGKGQKSG